MPNFMVFTIQFSFLTLPEVHFDEFHLIPKWKTSTCAVSKNKLMFRCVERKHNIQQIMFWTLMSLPPKHSDKNNPATLKFCVPVWGWWNLAVIFGPPFWTMVAWPELWYIFYKQKVPTNKIGGTLPCKDSNTLHLDTLYSNIYIYIICAILRFQLQYIV